MGCCGHLAKLTTRQFIIVVASPHGLSEASCDDETSVRSFVLQLPPRRHRFSSVLAKTNDVQSPPVQSQPPRMAEASSNEPSGVEVKEALPRRWPYQVLSARGAGALVGHDGADRMAFFAPSGPDAVTPCDTLRVIRGHYQHVLQCGDRIFLLHECSWWYDDRILADVVDLYDEAPAVRVDVTPLRDALASLLAGTSQGQNFGDPPSRHAVSATRNHFVFHINTASGAKLAGAVELPPSSCANGDVLGSDRKPVLATVSYARRWGPGHIISKMEEPNEMPVEDALLLYGSWDAVGLHRRSRGLEFCLVASDSGETICRRLHPPSSNIGSQSVASRLFEKGGIGALAVARDAGLVFGCSRVLRGLCVPAVVVWDFASGVPLANFAPSVRLDDLNIHPPRSLRFKVGDPVECFIDAWAPGRIYTLHYREKVWPPGETVPYQILLDDGNLVFAPADTARLVRRPRRAGDASDNSDDDVDDEVFDLRYEPCLAVCPKELTVVCALFHKGRSAARAHVLEFGGDYFERS